MPVDWKAQGALFKEAFEDWKEDKATRLAAALAYYTIFSIAPLLVIVIAVAGFFWPESGQVQDQLVAQMQGLLGSDGADLIRTMLEQAQAGGGGVLATVLGTAALIFGATGVFAQLQDALNTVWEVEPRPDLGFMGIVRTRLLSFGMVLSIGFLMLIFLVISAVLSAVDAFLTGLAPGLQLLMQAANLVVSFGVITLLFAMIFKYLPDVEIEWREVWTGAAVTALLFVVGKFAIGLYLGNSSTASAYGAAGSLVVLLLWVYYSSLILFFGAEITQVHARLSGHQIEPSSHAVRMLQAKRFVDPTPRSSQQPAPAGDLAEAGRLPDAPRPAARPASPLKRLAPLAAAFFIGRIFGRKRS